MCLTMRIVIATPATHPSNSRHILGQRQRSLHRSTHLASYLPPARAENLNLDVLVMQPANQGVFERTSSVITLKAASVHGPNEVTIATSVASRPRAIRMRPMRGLLWRASNVYQRPPR